MDTKMGSIQNVVLEDLNIDHSYQRDLDPALVQKIADDWEYHAAGPIVVSKRVDGSMWIVNGQHRAAAAKTAGHKEILAQVVAGLDRKTEAELRLKGNTRRGDKSQERFKAQVAAKHKESLEIVQLCKNFDTRINPWPDVRQGINAVAAVEHIYRRDGGLLLTRTFEVIADAWGHVGGENATTNTMKGIAWLISKHEGEIERQRLIDKLKLVGPDGLARKAANYKAALGGANWLNYYRAIVESYNDKLSDSNRLEFKAGRSWDSPVRPLQEGVGGTVGSS